jgi:NAD(P)H dehydrogenase (quinone)
MGKNSVMKFENRQKPSQSTSLRTVLIVWAHPEPKSLTCEFANFASRTLQSLGQRVLHSDLHALDWKAVVDGADFQPRANPERLSVAAESGHAWRNGTQAADVQREQDKLMSADAVIFQFPLWWFGMPAIMKGWIDRVFALGLAYGYKGAGNSFRYGEGGLAGKRALISTTAGGPKSDFSPRGINGPLEHLLWPITHGTLFFAGMEVLPTHAIFGAGRISQEDVRIAQQLYAARLERLFDEAPIPFRSQNGGDYPDKHVLGAEVAAGCDGFLAHLAECDASGE